jgi:hypothetical protein
VNGVARALSRGGFSFCLTPISNCSCQRRAVAFLLHARHFYFCQRRAARFSQFGISTIYNPSKSAHCAAPYLLFSTNTPASQMKFKFRHIKDSSSGSSLLCPFAATGVLFLFLFSAKELYFSSNIEEADKGMDN